MIAKVQNITLWTMKVEMDPGGLWWAQGANSWAHGYAHGRVVHTFEIGTQIILLQIDGFLQRLDVKYHLS